MSAPGLVGNKTRQPQLVESNEQALSFNVHHLSHGESKAAYNTLQLGFKTV